MSETQPGDILQRYDYRPRLRPLVWGGVTSSAVIAALAWLAVWVPPGVLRSTLFGAAGGGAAGWLVGAVVNTVLLLRPSRAIVLTSGAIHLPRSQWSAVQTRVAYDAVRKLQLLRPLGPLGPRNLVIEHEGGKATLADAMLPTKNDLDAILTFLRERTGQ